MAQGILFNEFYRHMYNLSMRIIANHHDVEDVLIMSFTKVFNSIEKFEYRGDHSLNKWIKTIVVNESIRFINAKNKMSFEDDLIDPNLFTNNEPELEDIDAEQIYSIIEAMPDGYRVVFNLFALEGYSHKEIAELLEISENTSKSQLRKARIHIIEKLTKTKKYGYSGN